MEEKSDKHYRWTEFIQVNTGYDVLFQSFGFLICKRNRGRRTCQLLILPILNFHACDWWEVENLTYNYLSELTQIKCFHHSIFMSWLNCFQYLLCRKHWFSDWEARIIYCYIGGLKREQAAGVGEGRLALWDVCPDPLLGINTSNYARD